MTDIVADMRDGKIWVEFEYDRQVVWEIKQIPGFRFVGPNSGGPAWRAALDFETCIAMRKMWEDDLLFTPELTNWGREVGSQKISLASLHTTEDVELPVLAERLPILHDALRNYQRVGAKFIATPDSNPIIADEPGLGKTWTATAGLFEAGIPDTGPCLVVAPLTALETVWLSILNQIQDLPVFVPLGGRREREDALEDLLLMAEIDEPYWLVVNPGMIAYKRVGLDEHGEDVIQPQYPQLHEIHWKAVIADEVHKAAMSNTSSLTGKAFYDLHCDKRVAISGTPLGGKPIKLYGILHWLFPKTFKSKWNFANQWLFVEVTHFGRKIGKVRPERQEAFDKMMAPYMLRRTKKEVAPELRDPLIMHIEVDMDGKQLKQYNQMKLEAEVAIEEMFGAMPEGTSDSIMAQGVLAEYTRLKQFANGYSTLGRLMPNGRRKVVPIPEAKESNKMRVLLGLLEERGISDDDYDDPNGQKVVIFSQFSEMVKATAEMLTKAKIRCDILTGDTPGNQRLSLVQDFQKDGGNRVLLMTTTAGGVAITLDRADTVIFLDETWVPDDQEQAINRVHRISRIHDVQAIYIRSKNSIEDYIHKLTTEKQTINYTILDAWRPSYLTAAGITEEDNEEDEEDDDQD